MPTANMSVTVFISVNLIKKNNIYIYVYINDQLKVYILFYIFIPLYNSSKLKYH